MLNIIYNDYYNHYYKNIYNNDIWWKGSPQNLKCI